MDKELRAGMVDVAREFVHGPPSYSFSEREQRVLRPFFSNTDKKVFFIQRLPEAVCASLLAMYSRMKNPRGLRGHFVDHLVPLLMYAPRRDEPREWRTVQAQYRSGGLATIDSIVNASVARLHDLEMFLRASANPEYWVRIADSERITEFLGMWLDRFGHNSIARPAQLVFGVEDISILAAKSLEWGRPGSGYIELSTRYVDFSGKATYPIERELELIDRHVASLAAQNIGQGLTLYQVLMGDNVDGVFPAFLKEQWGAVVRDKKGLASGVLGEACDVLGNLLPCATLTSLGVSVSGESLPELLKHLILDDTPENDALAELLIQEASNVGAGHFIRHLDISEWRRAEWSYLTATEHAGDFTYVPSSQDVELKLRHLFSRTGRFSKCGDWNTIIDTLCSLERSAFDKLPHQFEHVEATFGGVMSFRGWRDLHRQGFCTHSRSYVTPHVGFYRYPKAAPPSLQQSFERIHNLNKDAWLIMRRADVPRSVRQYAMAIGNLVNYVVAANLRQWEFCNWQRSKWGVNDEVRQEFLGFEQTLRAAYPWWGRLSRADLTPHYVFARGSDPVALPIAE